MKSTSINPMNQFKTVRITLYMRITLTTILWRLLIKTWTVYPTTEIRKTENSSLTPIATELKRLISCKVTTWQEIQQREV